MDYRFLFPFNIPRFKLEMVPQQLKTKLNYFQTLTIWLNLIESGGVMLHTVFAGPVYSK